MTRLFLSLALVAAGAVTVTAQSLTAPDDPAAAPAVAVADSTTAPAVEPLHNTPTDSYRDERNFIRHGNTMANDSNWHRALEYYQKALHVNAGSIVGRYNRAVALQHLASSDNNLRQQAMQQLAELLPDARKHNPAVARDAFYNLGNMAYNDRDYSGAIANYEASLRIDPDNYNARYNLRLAQLQQQNQDQNQDQQEQEQEQEQEQQQQQQPQQQQQQLQQQPQTDMTQSAQQILQSMQNKENQTRQRVQEEEEQAQPSRRQPRKPW